MSLNFLRIRLAFLAALLCLLASSFPAGAAWPEVDQADRAKILSLLIRQQLAHQHYSHKSIDDGLSEAAFKLYLKQLDSQKRFLLQTDVDRLQEFQDKIDDEINQGQVQLPQVAAELVRLRVGEAQAMVEKLLGGKFDFQMRESFQSDPEKLEFCKTRAELQDRWRKTLKAQIASRYLNLLEAGNALPDAAEILPMNPELLAKAQEKVRNRLEDLFFRVLKETDQDYFDRYFNAVAEAFDPHTNYLPPQRKEDFDITMRGSLEGIGATLREEGGFIKVVRIIPGSAASRQGQLQAEDLILEVAQGDGEPVDVTDMRLREAVSLIRGKKGTEVRLGVKKPDGARLTVPIVRDVVQIEETFVKGTTLKDPGSGKTFGYLKIPSFYRDFQNSSGDGRNSTDDVRQELEKFQREKIDGMVIDLRNNGGGALTDAVNIAGLFIESGPVVQVKNSYGQVQTLSDSDADVLYRGPIVVLVNKFSASASEILAGALQDYGRALIIGSQHTHGKGTVQSLLDLDRTLHGGSFTKYKPLGAMKITTQKFYRVSGDSTQYRGVVPDIVLPDRFEYVKSGEQYIENSLPWDSVPATDYSRWTPAKQNLKLLRQSSEQRLAKNQKFQEILRESARIKEKSDHTLLSLDLADLLRERKKDDELLSKNSHLPATPAEDEEKSPAAPKDLRAEAAEDPYIGEAMHLLADLMGLNDTSLAESRLATPQNHYGRPGN